MYNLTRVFLWGLIISFLGSLPLGTLNIAAMQIGIQENVTQAIYFSLGCLLVEMIYVRISLVGIEWVRKQEKLMKVMDDHYKKTGERKIRLGSQDLQRTWKMKQEYLSKRYTTNFNEILQIPCR